MFPTFRLAHLLIVVVFTAAFVLASVDAHALYEQGGDAYRIGDWLINYSGGFVRRGLAGHLLGWMSDAGSVPLLPLVFILQLALYFTLLVLAYVLVRPHLSTQLGLLFLVLSPATFLFEALNRQSFRKELLALVALGGLALAKRHAVSPKLLLLTATAVFPLIVLSHEALFVLAPFVLLLASSSLSRSDRWLAVLFAGACVLAFVIALGFPGDRDTARQILNSYDGLVPPPSLSHKGRHGAIGALASDAQQTNAQVMVRLFSAKARYVERYSLAAGAILLAFFLNRSFLARFLAGRRQRALLLLTMVLTLCLMSVAYDWGRLFYWLATATTLTALSMAPRPDDKPRTLGPALLISCAALWFGLSWRLPVSSGPLQPGLADAIATALGMPGLQGYRFHQTKARR